MNIRQPIAIAILVSIALMSPKHTAIALDAGTGKVPLPVDISVFNNTPLYLEDVDVVVNGDNISADPNGWTGTYYTATINPPYLHTMCSDFWGTGSIGDGGLYADGGLYPGYPACRLRATNGETAATAAANRASQIDPLRTSNTKVLIYQFGLNDGLTGATSAATCSSLQSYGTGAVAAGWVHPWIIGVLDSINLPPGFASAVNTCIRSGWASWGLAGFVDVGADPQLGLSPRANGPDCTSNRLCYYNSDNQTLSRPNGTTAYAWDIFTAINAANNFR